MIIHITISFLGGGLVVNRPGVRHSSEPRKRFPNSGSSDEDPYSLTPSGSSGSSGKGNNNGANSRIPPGEKEFFGPQNWAKVIFFKYIELLFCRYRNVWIFFHETKFQFFVIKYTNVV